MSYISYQQCQKSALLLAASSMKSKRSARSLLHTGAFDVSSHVFFSIVFKRLLICVYHNIPQINDYSTAYKSFSRTSMSNILVLIFPAQRYASTVHAMTLCLSVTSWCLLKRLDGLSWFVPMRLPSTYPTLCCKEIRVTAKIRVLPTGWCQ